MVNINKINRKLKEAYGNKVKAEFKDNIIYVKGELENWQDVVKACQIASKKFSKIHVVNDIKCKNIEIPKMRMPSIKDKSIDGEKPDVLIIGGGISGVSIARELRRYNINVLLVEKEADVALGASGRNDGVVHVGIDLNKGSLKQHYVLLGNDMYGDFCKDLDVPFTRDGQVAVFTDGWAYPLIKMFVLQRELICGIRGTRIVKKKELLEMEPNITPKAKFGMFSASAGEVCPYGVTIACAENAVANGAKVSLNTAVTSMNVENGIIKSVTTNRGTVYPKIVINSAGVFAEEIAKMAKDRFYSIHPRKGTNIIMDKKVPYTIKSHTSLYSLNRVEKDKTTNSKGGGVVKTVHNNLLVGPDAVETYEKEDNATNAESINATITKQKDTLKEMNARDIITYFSGVRAPSFEEDFILEKGRKTKNIIHDAGIQSPGITAAPAIAKDIAKLAIEELSKQIKITPNEKFNGKRKGIPHVASLPIEERDKLIKQNPDYGEIVCRCEEISKGEIIDCLNSPLCVPTVDGIKKRIRPGMGRCQGGFCGPAVAKIISEHQNIELKDVRKSNDESIIVYGDTKGGAL